MVPEDLAIDNKRKNENYYDSKSSDAQYKKRKIKKGKIHVDSPRRSLLDNLKIMLRLNIN